jgi:hypothetical protein
VTSLHKSINEEVLKKSRSGKRVRGANEGSSLHLYAPENGVCRTTAFILLKQGTPTIMVEIEGVRRDLILDTGSNISIFQPGMSTRDVRCTSVKPYGITGETLEIRGQQTVFFEFKKHKFRHSFYVYSLTTKATVLIGMDLMEKTSAISISKRAGRRLPTSQKGRSSLVLHPPDKQPLRSFHGVKRDTAPNPANR